MTERSETAGAAPVRVQSVSRALGIVEYLALPEHAEGLPLGEIARHLGVSKSATHALLATLHDQGYVSKVEPGPRYLLGMSLMRLGEQVRHRLPIVEVARPTLRSLANVTSLTARLVVADRGRPLFVSYVEGGGAVRFSAQVGRHELPHSTGVGKAILATLTPAEVQQVVAVSGLVRRTDNTITDLDALTAELAIVSERGYAIDQEEEAEGIVCVAASVVDREGRCVGAISVSGLKVHLDAERVAQHGEAVRRHARQLSSHLGAPDESA